MSVTFCHAMSRVTSRQLSRRSHAMSTTPHHTYNVTSGSSCVGHLAFPTTEGATCEVPANATDPTTRQCEETCPVLADLKLQLRGARLAITVLRDALADEREGA